MAIFMGEDTYTTIFRLDGVFADPVITVADLDAAQHVEGRSPVAPALIVGIPAVAPDGLWRSTFFLSQASMHGLEGIDVAIRLIEVAIPIVVVAVPNIEIGKVGIDLSRCLAGRDLSGIP